jgi:hypothetical protein
MGTSQGLGKLQLCLLTGVLWSCFAYSLNRMPSFPSTTLMGAIPPTRLKPSVFLSLCVGMLGTLTSGTAVPTLLQNSPFIPPDFSPPQPNRTTRETRTTPNSFEFKGVYELGGQYRFLVKAAQASSGKWVEAGKSYDDFEVRGYDPESRTLTLFHNDQAEELALAQLEANPTPMPVSGQPAATAPAPSPGDGSARRVVQPPTRPSSRPSAADTPPPPAWLQKLRQEAAERRGGSPALPGTGVANPAVGPSGVGRNIPTPPTYAPPTPPPNLTAADIPPPPTGMPPEPPPEIMEQIRQSLSTRPGT